MKWLKYVIGLVVVIALCTVVWFKPPTKIEVNQLEEKVSILEEQIGGHYQDYNLSLVNTAEQLLAHDFNQPIMVEDELMIEELSNELYSIRDKLFYIKSQVLMHSDWEDKLMEVERYLTEYLSGVSFTKEEVADLNQGLHAIRFIAMDFGDIARYDTQAAYDAMHDEEHAMVERVKFRLSTKY